MKTAIGIIFMYTRCEGLTYKGKCKNSSVYGKHITDENFCLMHSSQIPNDRIMAAIEKFIAYTTRKYIDSILDDEHGGYQWHIHATTVQCMAIFKREISSTIIRRITDDVLTNKCHAGQ